MHASAKFKGRAQYIALTNLFPYETLLRCLLAVFNIWKKIEPIKFYHFYSTHESNRSKYKELGTATKSIKFVPFL